VVLGIDSVLVTLLFGGVGLGVAGGVTFLIGARLDDAVVTLRTVEPDHTAETTPGSDT
jgi:hypothetical protein